MSGYVKALLVRSNTDGESSDLATIGELEGNIEGD